MPQILFKRRFIDAIRRGDKTTTLRRWKSCRLRRGARVSVPGAGWLKILSCKPIKLKDLTDKDAQADGFTSLKDLLVTLGQLYPDQKSDGRKWYRVVFRHEEQEAGFSAYSPQDARTRLAKRIRDDLDKAVRSSGSLFPL